MKSYEAGLHAIDLAEMTWREHITDPRQSDMSPVALANRAKIDTFIRGKHGLGWTWRDPYKGDGDYEWCGAFAAFCWGRAAGLQPQHRLHWWSSTYRLDRWGSYSKLGINPKSDPPNPRPPAGVTPRLYVKVGMVWTAADLVKNGIVVFPGDIALVGKKEGYGVHVTLVERFDPQSGIFQTISGNGIGLLPDGSRGQGVVKRGYKTSEVRRLIRPSVMDWLPPPVTSMHPGRSL